MITPHSICIFRLWFLNRIPANIVNKKSIKITVKIAFVQKKKKILFCLALICLRAFYIVCIEVFCNCVMNTSFVFCSPFSDIFSTNDELKVFGRQRRWKKWKEKMITTSSWIYANSNKYKSYRKISVCLCTTLLYYFLAQWKETVFFITSFRN